MKHKNSSKCQKDVQQCEKGEISALEENKFFHVLGNVGDRQIKNWLSIGPNAHHNLSLRKQPVDDGMPGSDHSIPVPSSLLPIDVVALKHLSSSQKYLCSLAGDNVEQSLKSGLDTEDRRSVLRKGRDTK